MRCFDIAIVNNPAFALAYNAGGVLKAAGGDLDGVLNDLMLGARPDSELADPEANKGVVYLLYGAVPPETRKAPGFDEPVREDPTLALAHNGRGGAVFSAGD
jgi:hypothetical protein